MTKFAKFQLALVMLLISTGMFYGGYYFGKSGYLIELRKNPPKVEISNRYPGDQNVDFQLFWDVWDLVSNNYLERPIDSQELVYGAIEGMVNALGDPYSTFLKPELNQAFLNELNSTYQGIGAELAVRDNQLMVVAPIDGSPAEEAGLMSGDKILEIDGKSTLGLSVREAVFNIRGDAGTVVNLTIQRNEGVPFVATIKRGQISLDSVSWDDKGDGNIYIRVNRFGENTNRDWNKVVSEINANAPEIDTIILDLRGNPGGIIQGAQYISEEFYNGKNAFYTEDALGNRVDFPTKRIGAFKDIPALYVLIDEGSASAAEILASSLKVNANAVLIGKKSFGKGTMQTGFDLNDGANVHITTAKWLTADEQWIHGVGLYPDYEVDITAEDIAAGNDPQLNKALELANEI